MNGWMDGWMNGTMKEVMNDKHAYRFTYHRCFMVLYIQPMDDLMSHTLQIILFPVK